MAIKLDQFNAYKTRRTPKRKVVSKDSSYSHNKIYNMGTSNDDEQSVTVNNQLTVNN